MDAVPALLLLLAGVLLGAGACWVLLSLRFRVVAADAAKAATDATVTLRADAAAVRAERTGLLQRVHDLGAQYDQACVQLRRAEADAASAAASLRAEREAVVGREQLLCREHDIGRFRESPCGPLTVSSQVNSVTRASAASATARTLRLIFGSDSSPTSRPSRSGL